MQEAKLTNYQKKKRAELLLAVKKSRPKLPKEKLDKLDDFVKKNESLLKEMRKRERELNSPSIDLETLNKQTTKVDMTNTTPVKPEKLAGITTTPTKASKSNDILNHPKEGVNQENQRVYRQAPSYTGMKTEENTEMNLAGKILDSNEIINGKVSANQPQKEIQAGEAMKSAREEKKETDKQMQTDSKSSAKEVNKEESQTEKVYKVEIVDATKENSNLTKGIDSGNVKTVVLTQTGVREKKKEKKSRGLLALFKKNRSRKKEKKGVDLAETKETKKDQEIQADKEEVTRTTLPQKDISTEAKNVQLEKSSTGKEEIVKTKQVVKKKKSSGKLIKTAWRELSKFKVVSSIATEYNKTIEYKKLEAAENYTALEKSVYITTFFDIVTDRIFKPAEERTEYTAFLEEGVIDEKYSLRLAKQIAVLTGLFAFSLIIIGIYENIFKELIGVTFIREIIFSIPLALFYVVVIKFSKNLRIKDLFPISALTGGIYELVIAAILLFLNMYIFSSLFVATIGVFLLYFGVTRLDLDLNKISKQLTPPDKDKICPSCGRVIPKGENYCHNCERWVY